MNSTRWTLAIAAAVAMAFFTALVLIPFMTTTLSDGVASYSQGNFAKAYKELKPLADDGEPTAQYMLGEMFRMGQGVKKDEPAAVKWYKKAAERRKPSFSHGIGNLAEAERPSWINPIRSARNKADKVKQSIQRHSESPANKKSSAIPAAFSQGHLPANGQDAATRPIG
ncbi:MAG: sel1 repeat family protein [Alphaproteobacteria bacterium]|nr:sel1 repeat family protein [Alphaproteobacteria bacterium]